MLPKTLKHQIVELEAAQLPRSRADVDFAIVSGNYAKQRMKLTEALFQEPSFAYVNGWSAVRTADKDSQWLKDVTEAYNSDVFKAYSQKRFAGYKYPAAWGGKCSSRMLKPKPPLLLLQPNKSLLEKRPSERSDGPPLSSAHKVKKLFLID